MGNEDRAVDVGLIVYFLAPLVGVFIGPLAAIAFVVGYWLARSTGEAGTTVASTNR
ncbi:hypothetical protein [Halohasta litorea]|uniref:Uncharacterized protein n=1 Tax=Halohasta litorea TaxID=869891 RepID=A0ABD6DA81_9EURY|nr:hypothetical protein [Halohasta litorea]